MDIDKIKESSGNSKMSIIYINGLCVSVMGCVSEIDVQYRKGWVERTVRKSGNCSIEHFVECIRMSRFWLNYITMGTRYPGIVSKQTYLEWDNER